VVLHGVGGWRYSERCDEVGLSLRREVEVAQDEKGRGELNSRHTLAVQKRLDDGIGLSEPGRRPGSQRLCSTPAGRSESGYARP
jgi:hypothetical protein